MMSDVFDKISFVLTSCGRFDLLERTIESMSPWVFGFAEKILIDDSGYQHEILDHLHDRGFLILSNPSQQGQHYSIDRAYSQATCPYIFHCQDDWVFDRCPDLDLSRHVLDLNPRLSLISFINLEERCQRRYPEDYPQRLAKLTLVHHNGSTLRYPPFSQNRNNVYWSFSYSPHLIKRTTVERFFPYGQFIKERYLARNAQRKGYTLAYQSPGMCIHTGPPNVGSMIIRKS